MAAYRQPWSIGGWNRTRPAGVLPPRPDHQEHRRADPGPPSDDCDHLALTLTSVGCGGDEPPTTPSEDPPVTDDDGGGAAGGSTMCVFSVGEARSADVDGNLHVVGLLIDDGSEWRLCEEVLESHPPQCGGQTLTVEGLDPEQAPLDETGDTRWQTEAPVVGEVDGDTLTVAGSPASSWPPPSTLAVPLSALRTAPS